jgi:hypothetical protein
MAAKATTHLLCTRADATGVVRRRAKLLRTVSLEAPPQPDAIPAAPPPPLPDQPAAPAAAPDDGCMWCVDPCVRMAWPLELPLLTLPLYALQVSMFSDGARLASR